MKMTHTIHISRRKKIELTTAEAMTLWEALDKMFGGRKYLPLSPPMQDRSTQTDPVYGPVKVITDDYGTEVK